MKSRVPEIVEPKQLIQPRVLVKRARLTVKRSAARSNGKSKPPQSPGEKTPSPFRPDFPRACMFRKGLFSAAEKMDHGEDAGRKDDVADDDSSSVDSADEDKPDHAELEAAEEPSASLQAMFCEVCFEALTYERV